MILVMKTETAEDVEGSDNLRVYTFSTRAAGPKGIPPGKFLVEVVANRTNVYEVGDIVAVAMIGSTPKYFGNFEVTQRKVFGIESFGMALGKVPELIPGLRLEDDWPYSEEALKIHLEE